MLQCPVCGTTYTDTSLRYCLTDRAQLAPVEQETVVRSVNPVRVDIPRATEVASAFRAPAVEEKKGGFPIFKVLLAVVGLGIVVVGAVGMIGAFFYFNSRGNDSNQNGKNSSNSPSATPTLDPDRQRLQDQIANMWQVQNGKVVELPMPADGGGLAVPQMIEFDKVARDPAVSDAQKAIAIAWLEHLIGDIHQPLHASARVSDLEPKGDMGGNTFLLTPKDTPREKQENLHWFWDSIIVRAMPNTKDQCDADYLDPIAQDIMKDYPFAKMQSRLDLGDFNGWRKESFEIASTKVFPPDLNRFEFPSDKYKKEALKISEERIALAGYRIGELFNQIFGAPAAAVSTPAK